MTALDEPLALRDEIARIIDPDAFDHHPAEARRTMASVQWGARRRMAEVAADNVLPWLQAREAALSATPLDQIILPAPASTNSADARVAGHHFTLGSDDPTWDPVLGGWVRCECGWESPAILPRLSAIAAHALHAEAVLREDRLDHLVPSARADDEPRHRLSRIGIVQKTGRSFVCCSCGWISHTHFERERAIAAHRFHAEGRIR